MRTVQRLVVAFLLWSAAPALGHEGGVDLRGVVVSADEGHVTVRGADGKEQRFVLTPKTRVLVEGRAATPVDLALGQRAVVHARKMGGRLEAESVRASMPKGLPAR